MVLDLTDVTPFFTWLLGPGWTEGRIFQPVLLVVLLALVGAGLVWSVVAVRSGRGATTRRGGTILAGAMAVAVLLAVLAAGVWWALLLLFPAKIAAVQIACLDGLAWLLGTGWYQGAAYQWIAVVFCATGIALALGWLVTAVRRGPIEALVVSGQVAGDGLLDTLRISPRRVWALASLAVKESVRRRVVVVFGVFIVILLFAGWYLDPENPDPARVYLDFVLTATSYLVLLLVLFLSSLSLPADLKSRTLHTVMTKPVRASEVVLGRIVGFAAVMTLLLLPMAAISYVFVERGLAHTHELAADDLQPAEGGAPGQPAALQGHTSLVHGHRHKVFIDAAGRGEVAMEQRHTHPLTVQKDGGKVTYRIGPAEGMLVARVPIYGKLAFRDRTGQPAEKGINVGDEWTYRSFIEGGTLAAAVWSFQGITPEQFPDGLPVELTLEAFRTYKGNIEKAVLGSLWVRNPASDKNKPVMVTLFDSKDFVIDVHHVPREWQTASGKKIDLFKDVVSKDGRVEVWLKCDDRQQYFGVAQADMYLRARNASFAANFVKGYAGIWLTALLVIALGVMYSTFLSAPVAMLATLGTLVAGFFHDFMFRLATGQTLGGGPVESIGRILSQQNMTGEAEPGLATTVAQTLDRVAEFGLRMLAAVLPDFSRFSFAEFVASGFNIPGDTLMTYACRTFAFVLPVFVVAYLCLKNREVAQ